MYEYMVDEDKLVYLNFYSLLNDEDDELLRRFIFDRSLLVLKYSSQNLDHYYSSGRAYIASTIPK
jgi:hypothetical protein